MEVETQAFATIILILGISLGINIFFIIHKPFSKLMRRIENHD